ncbi:hypothetical protein [Nocardia sp. NPDC019395]|uniref:hypothetical protein n=1 Tax=Nocardia sp. NPDC019395 TaxID=3154686 RepID=UPI0033DF1954
MPDQWETPEQVRGYIARAFDTDREFAVYPTEFGWVCREERDDDDPEAGMGQGNYVVNRQTGVITAHGSLHPIMIGEMYDEDIRSGEPVQGYQVYPPTWEIHVDRVRDTPEMVEYRVRGRSLTEPPEEPPTEHLLTIDKRTYHYHTDSAEIHVTCSHTVTWSESRLRRDGTWPATGILRA